MREPDGGCLAVLLFCLGIACSFGAGYGFAARVFRDNAVKAGHAEYYLDDNHSRQWRWLPTESEQQNGKH